MCENRLVCNYYVNGLVSPRAQERTRAFSLGSHQGSLARLACALRKDMALVAPPHGPVTCAEQNTFLNSCGARFLRNRGAQPPPSRVLSGES